MYKVYKPLNIPITVWFVIALLIIFIIEFFIPQNIFSFLIFYPHYAFQYPWMFITSLFMDQGIYQLLFDGLALFFLGIAFEYLYGTKNFVILFLLSGIVGNLAFLIQYFNNPTIAGLGSSGAISGILGALAILKPKEKVIIFPIIIPIDIIYAAIFWIIFNAVGIIYPFTSLGFSAHLGGTLFGMLYGYILKNKMENKSDIIIN